VEWQDAPPQDIVPEPIPLSIIYEDKDVLVIDKPQGMVTHPAAGNWQGTLANAFLWKLNEEARVQDEHHGNQSVYTAQAAGPLHAPPLRAGIVHRLDKDTSGIIILAKHLDAQHFLAQQFHDRTVRKTYIAIVNGKPPKARGSIDSWLARSAHDRKNFS